MNNSPDHPSFKTRTCLVDLNMINLAENKWQRKSEKFNFTREDMVSDAELNEVIWKAVKGIGSECPSAVHSAFFIPETRKDKDEN
jgi:hypothetical protein